MDVITAASGGGKKRFDAPSAAIRQIQDAQKLLSCVGLLNARRRDLFLAGRLVTHVHSEQAEETERTPASSGSAAPNAGGKCRWRTCRTFSRQDVTTARPVV